MDFQAYTKVLRHLLSLCHCQSEQYKQDKQDKQEFDGYVDSESDSWMNLEVDVSDESGLLKKYPFLNILIGIVGGN